MAENAARTDDQLRAVYQEICVSYRAIDDFRAKLLGFLPVVTGAGVGLLLGRDPGDPQPIWLPVGLFGAVVTLGLFAYEVHGIKKCAYLIDAGARLERYLEVYGQFAGRPHAVGVSSTSRSRRRLSIRRFTRAGSSWRSPTSPRPGPRA